MVEFALTAPIACLLLFGIVIFGIVVMHQTQLTNTSRNLARSAAICGERGYYNSQQLPNGQVCTDANLLAYAQAQLGTIDSSVSWTPSFTVTDGSGNTVGSSLSNCQAGYQIKMSVTYYQNLYIPMVARLVSNTGSNTFRITTQGVAACEQ